MPLMVSVSGVRGVVGVDLTPPSIIKYLHSFVRLLGPPPGRILIGRDTRDSGRIIDKIVEGTINALGYDSLNIGIAPTPTILLATRKYGCIGGIAITASHNPPQWNALKLCDENGLLLTEDKVDKLGAYVEKHARPSIQWKGFQETGKSTFDDRAKNLHIEEVLKLVDRSLIQDKKFRVAIDPGGGTGAVIDREFLKELGCTVTAINDRPQGFFPRDPEPIPEHLSGLSNLVKTSGADIGFAQDPDADRLSLVSDTGSPIGEEYTIVLAGEAYLRKQKTDIACNLSTSMMVDDLGRRHGVRVIRTKIGEIHVTSTLISNGLNYGGEGNGGVIVPSTNPCRDSIVGMGLILELLAIVNRPLSRIIYEFPSYIMRKIKVPLQSRMQPSASEDFYNRIVQCASKFLKNYSYITLDGIKFYTDDEWLHIRNSNTEPAVRIMAESKTKKQTEKLLDIGIKLVAI